MFRFIVGRLLMAVPTAIGLVTITFFLLRALPGDPAIVMLGDFATQESLEALRRNLGLDDSPLRQYWNYVYGAATGDLGNSIVSRRPALDQVMAAMRPSLILAFAALFVAVAGGILIGTYSALRRGTWVDLLTMFITIGAISMPAFWLGLLAILFFAGFLGVLPAIGMGQAGDIMSQIRALILPAVVLGLGPLAFVARLTRSALLETLGQDYIRTAKSLGISPKRIHLKYALRNALTPILGVVAVSFALAIGNAILVEVVFSRPGIGSLLIRSTLSRDYPIVQAAILVLTLSVVVVNLLTDLAYPIVDPRIRRR